MSKELGLVCPWIQSIRHFPQHQCFPYYLANPPQWPQSLRHFQQHPWLLWFQPQLGQCFPWPLLGLQMGLWPQWPQLLRWLDFL